MVNQKTLDLIKENLKDPSLYDIIYKAALRQARKTAIELGSVLIVALIAFVYAFVQQTNVQVVNRRLVEQMGVARLMKLETEKQAALAIEAKLIAEEANKQVLEQLKECEQRKKK